MRWMITALLITFFCFGVAHAGLVDNGDGTVTDTATGLMWQKCSYGQNWTDGQCTGSAVTRTWQQSLEAAETLTWSGYNDWRLPNRNELQSLVDYSRYQPAIDPEFASVSSHYWSSTTYAGSTSYAWRVNFASGGVRYYRYKSNSYYVRAVRGGHQTTEQNQVSFNISNVSGGAVGLEGIWRVEVYDQDGEPVEEAYSNDSSVNMSLPFGQYRAKIYFLFDDGLGVWEFWGQRDFSVDHANVTVPFTRNMPWHTGITPWMPTLEPGESLKVTCPVKNELAVPIVVMMQGQLGGGNVLESNVVTIPGNSSTSVSFQFDDLPKDGVWPLRYWVQAIPPGEDHFVFTDHSEFSGFLTMQSSGGQESDYLCMDYRDADNNLWQIGLDFNDITNPEWFYEPKSTFKNLVFYKNGKKISPTVEQMQEMLNRVARQFEPIYPSIFIGKQFDENYNIWRQACGFAWPCHMSLISFDGSTRKRIYKELIWEGVTSRNYPALNTEYIVPAEKRYVASSLPVKLTTFLDQLWERQAPAIGDVVTSFDYIKKIQHIALASETDPILKMEINAESEALGNVIEMLQLAELVGNIGLETIQNIILMDFLASTGFAEQRLATLKKAYGSVRDNVESRIDPVLLEAIQEVEAELSGKLDSLGNTIVASFLRATKDQLGNSDYVKGKLIDLAVEELGQKLVGSVAKNLKLSQSAVSSAVITAVKNIVAVRKLGDDWRRIHLNGMLSAVIVKYAQNDPEWSAAAYPQGGVMTFNLLNNHHVRDVFDLQSVFASEYLNQGLQLVDPNWLKFAEDAVASTLDMAAKPQLYAISYASTAIVFGEQVGKELNNLAYSDSLEAAREMVRYITDAAEKKNRAMNEWGELFVGVRKPVLPGVLMLLLDDE